MRRSSLILFLLGAIAPVNAQAPDSRLSLDRIFASGDFRGDAVSPVHWLNGGSFVTLRPSKSHTGAMDIVRVGKAGNGEVIVPSAKLIPPKSHDPLAIDRYDLSNDLDLVLIYTNSRKVWRQNTRGDYWTFRRSTGTLAKIGRDAKPSTLMFAKLSPDGS
ncbi:MAG TPA: DPP IV N-terminal domain-containing protein, partial [Fimbriiglobus sp.]